MRVRIGAYLTQVAQWLAPFALAGIAITTFVCSGFASAPFSTESLAFREYAEAIHPNMVRHCAACHSEREKGSKAPRHSHTNPAQAFSSFQQTLNFPRPEASTLFRRIESQHYCLEWGENCDSANAIQTEIVDRVRSWLSRHATSGPSNGESAATLVVPHGDEFSGEVAVTGASEAARDLRVFLRFKRALGDSFHLDRAELRGPQGRWRARQFSILVNNHRLPGATAFDLLDVEPLLQVAPDATLPYSTFQLIKEKPLLLLSPGDVVSLQGKLDPSQSGEPNECPDLATFKEAIIPYARIGFLEAAGWLGYDFGGLQERLSSEAGRDRLAPSLCRSFLNRLSPMFSRSPLFSDYKKEAAGLAQVIRTLQGSRPQLSKLAQTRMIRFKDVKLVGNGNYGSIGCAQTADDKLYCWGGRFGAPRPGGTGYVFYRSSTFSFDKGSSERYRIQIPEPVESFALGRQGLYCAIGNSKRVWCGGAAVVPSTHRGLANNGWEFRPLGGNWAVQPLAWTFLDSLRPDVPERLVTSHGDFCALMGSGRVFCWGPGYGGKVTFAEPPTLDAVFPPGQLPVAIPIPDRIERLFAGGSDDDEATSGEARFCGVAGSRFYCWGTVGADSFVSERDQTVQSNPNWISTLALEGMQFPEVIRSIELNWFQRGCVTGDSGHTYCFKRRPLAGLSNLTASPGSWATPFKEGAEIVTARLPIDLNVKIVGGGQPACLIRPSGYASCTDHPSYKSIPNLWPSPPGFGFFPMGTPLKVMALTGRAVCVIGDDDYLRCSDIKLQDAAPDRDATSPGPPLFDLQLKARFPED